MLVKNVGNIKTASGGNRKQLHTDFLYRPEVNTYILDKYIVSQTSGTCTGVIFIPFFHKIQEGDAIVKTSCCLYSRFHP